MAFSLPTPRKSTQPKPAPTLVWALVRFALPTVPKVASRRSAGGPAIVSARNLPLICPPTPPAPPKFELLDPSSSYVPSIRTIMPGQNHAPSSGTGLAIERSSTTLPDRSVMARSPVAEFASKPRSKCDVPDRPSRFEIGVILYAC